MSYLLRESHLIISIKSDRVHFYKVAPYQLAIIAGILQLINNLIELVLRFSKD